jgi:hypothetical protein
MAPMQPMQHRDRQQQAQRAEQQLAADARQQRRAGERAGVVQHVRRRAQHRGAEGRERRADSVELVARGPGR